MKWSKKAYKSTLNAALFILVLSLPVLSFAGMSDYCIKPPMIGATIKPNLLMMIDNSASMYDLSYIDEGQFTGSCSLTGVACSDTVDCPTGETCTTNVTFTRDPNYCYDQTYSNGNTYVGYFETTDPGTALPIYYEYDFTNNHFIKYTGTFPPVSCTKTIADTLCVNCTDGTCTTAGSVDAFVAKGNYLNWLTSSKFDVQKQILTGGKYDDTNDYFIAESRGCVGRGFVKEALTGDFVNYASPETNNTNTSIGITFSIEGPPDAFNPAGVSEGGQTYINIYPGDYDHGKCQNAIDLIEADAVHSQIRTAVEECLDLGSFSNKSIETKQKVVFQQTIQECWQYNKMAEPKTVGNDAINTAKNQCPDVYYAYRFGTCKIAGTPCSSAVSCTAPGDYCVSGPLLVTAGNPAYLCGAAYVGACVIGGAPNWGKNDVDWGGTVDDHTGDACIIEMHNRFCGDFGRPQVVDPTDDSSASDSFDNIPAIISDMGIESQLGDPIMNLTVKIKETTTPTGVIKEFEDSIRMGAMTFNFDGSPTECAGGDIPCPKVCSTDNSQSCGSSLDCPSPATATCDVAAAYYDGGQVLHYIGYGHCSVTTATACAKDAHCPGGEKCVSDGVGDHTTGLIKAIDDIRGASWTPFAESYYNAIGYFAKDAADSTGKTSRTDLRINAGDFDQNFNPQEYDCQKNNVLLVTDGMSTADQYSSMMSLVTTYRGATDTGVCAKYAGSQNLDDLSWIAKNRDINEFSTSTDDTKLPTVKSDNIQTFVVFNGVTNGETGDCDSATLLAKTATNGGTTMRQADKPEELAQELQNAFYEIAAETVSGTAASVLASGEGSGANLVQAIFFPTKTFGSQEIQWIGKLSNFWFYVDPRYANSTIREDDGDKVLNLATTATEKDYVTSFYYDMTLEKAMATRWPDADGDGTPENPALVPDIEIESVGNLWEAGSMLWSRDFLGADPRKIWTVNVTGTATPNGLIEYEFDPVSKAELAAYQLVADNKESEAVIRWTRGEDTPFVPAIGGFAPDYRQRSATIGGVGPYTWKLGDILNSTPKLSTYIPLNWYHEAYRDITYGYSLDPPLSSAPDESRYTTTSRYKARNTVFVGANDGMLHAFKLGTLSLDWSGQNKQLQPARLEGTAAELGKEVWAFIPKNVLPYLKHLADVNYPSCHLYSVDLTPFVFDATIGKPTSCAESDITKCTRNVESWRTIVIGGMRLGGACRDSTSSCDEDTECVKSPAPGKGFSSYFALDITDELDPVFLWEFSQADIGTADGTPGMGFASSGPAVVRISTKNASNQVDPSLNGKWFVVFGSGPTGPINTGQQQFMGASNQNLQMFILDLFGPGSGSWTQGTNFWVKDTTIANAFSGSLYDATHDSDQDYSDDAVYVPYVKKHASVAEWTQGGVGRLLTRESTNPATWEWGIVIDNVGPITSAITKLQNLVMKNFWLGFGAGRYFYEIADDPDDPVTRRQIFGLKDPCYSEVSKEYFATCPSALSLGDLTNVDDPAVAEAIDSAAAAFKGWYINLDDDGTYTYAEGNPPVDKARNYRTERIITDPLAIQTGVIFFTSYKPYDDPCLIGGKTFIWAVKFDTGGSAGTLLRGRAIIQVSTGNIEQVELGKTFTDRGGRRSAALEGVPPTQQGLSVQTSPAPILRIIHRKER